MPHKKIAVLGAGANGASIGAGLTRAGLDVALIDQWPEHVAAMRTNGARIEMPDAVLEVPVRACNLGDVIHIPRHTVHGIRILQGPFRFFSCKSPAGTGKLSEDYTDVPNQAELRQKLAAVT